MCVCVYIYTHTHMHTIHFGKNKNILLTIFDHLDFIILVCLFVLIISLMHRTGSMPGSRLAPNKYLIDR